MGKRLLATFLTCILTVLCALGPLGNAETVRATTAVVAYVYTDSNGYHVVPSDSQVTPQSLPTGYSPGKWICSFDACIDKRYRNADGSFTGDDPSHFDIPACIEIFQPIHAVPGGITDPSPAIIAGYPVSTKGEVCNITQIGCSAFMGCDTIKTLNIPNSISKIGVAAFCDCDNLESLIIPPSVRNIEASAFANCDSLKSVKILSRDINIGDGAFSGCTNLETITFPDTVSSLDIGDMAFWVCPLTDVTIPDGAKSIGAQAFGGCRLTEITIPDSVEIIGDLAFSHTALTSIAIPKNVSSIGANPGWGAEILLDEENTHYTLEDGILYDKDKTRLIACLSSKTGSVTIPDSVTEIGDDAFVNCSGLEQIVIPDSVERIGELAFFNCVRLTSIRIPEHVSEIGESGSGAVGGTAFEGCGNLLTITVDEKNETYSSEDGILYNKDKTRLIACPCRKTGDLAIPQTVTAISESAFYGGKLTTIALPDTMESISSYFYYCNSLLGIIIPDSVTDIREGIFMGCENLTIYGNEGSYAETYAQEHNIPFSTGTPPKSPASNPYDLMKPVVGYELSLADASGRTLTRKDFASGNTLLVFGRPTCPNTMWFINEIIPWKDVLEQNQVHVVVVFENEQQIKESAGQIPFTCTYEKDIIKENWEFDMRCGLTDSYITFPRVVLQNAQGYAFYYSTGFVNEPERVLATALQKLPVTEDISKVIQQNNNTEPPKETEPPKAGDSIVVNGTTYQVTSSGTGKKEVSFILGNKKSDKITIPAAITVNGISYKVTSIANNAFNGCKKLKSVTIGKNVTKIGDSAFFKCTSLKKITIPANVTKIGKKAFYGCKNVKTIKIKTQKLKSSSVGAQAFKGIHKKAAITVPKKQKKAYKKWLKKKGLTKNMKIK